MIRKQNLNLQKFDPNIYHAEIQKQKIEVKVQAQLNKETDEKKKRITNDEKNVTKIQINFKNSYIDKDLKNTYKNMIEENKKENLENQMSKNNEEGVSVNELNETIPNFSNRSNIVVIESLASKALQNSQLNDTVAYNTSQINESKIEFTANKLDHFQEDNIINMKNTINKQAVNISNNAFNIMPIDDTIPYNSDSNLEDIDKDESRHKESCKNLDVSVQSTVKLDTTILKSAVLSDQSVLSNICNVESNNKAKSGVKDFQENKNNDQNNSNSSNSKIENYKDLNTIKEVNQSDKFERSNKFEKIETVADNSIRIGNNKFDKGIALPNNVVKHKEDLNSHTNIVNNKVVEDDFEDEDDINNYNEDEDEQQGNAEEFYKYKSKGDAYNYQNDYEDQDEDNDYDHGNERQEDNKGDFNNYNNNSNYNYNNNYNNYNDEDEAGDNDQGKYYYDRVINLGKNPNNANNTSNNKHQMYLYDDYKCDNDEEETNNNIDNNDNMRNTNNIVTKNNNNLTSSKIEEFRVENINAINPAVDIVIDYKEDLKPTTNKDITRSLIPTRESEKLVKLEKIDKLEMNPYFQSYNFSKNTAAQYPTYHNNPLISNENLFNKDYDPPEIEEKIIINIRQKELNKRDNEEEKTISIPTPITFYLPQ